MSSSLLKVSVTQSSACGTHLTLTKTNPNIVKTQTQRRRALKDAKQIHDASGLRAVCVQSARHGDKVTFREAVLALSQLPECRDEAFAIYLRHEGPDGLEVVYRHYAYARVLGVAWKFIGTPLQDEWIVAIEEYTGEPPSLVNAGHSGWARKIARWAPLSLDQEQREWAKHKLVEILIAHPEKSFRWTQ